MTIETLGEWKFETVVVRARKVEEYGNRYLTVATITVVDGEPHVEGLLGVRGIDVADINTLHDYLVSAGYEYYTSSRFVDGERKTTRTKL